MLLRLEGVDVWTASREPANEIAEALGAHYVCTDDGDLAELGRFDLVVECAGDAQLMADSLSLLGRSGVACLLGIDGREQKVELDGRVIGLDTVLENRVLFGSVNAHHDDWLAGVEALDRARQQFPGALEQLVALRVPLDRFREAFAFTGGKATLVLDDGV
jgi:threonine dehydrogenase-like Zn-dependent dehydrogenase